MSTHTKHSVIGASSCERWWNCPGSVPLISALPPERSSIYALEGTAAHDFLAKCLEYNSDPEIAFGHVIRVFDDPFQAQDFLIDHDMVCAVKDAMAEIQSDLDLNIRKELLIEQSFELKSLDPGAFGTADAVLIGDNSLTVYDFKYGKGVLVDAYENKQLLYYALGAFLKIQEEERDIIAELESVILQPRLDGGVSRFSYSPVYLLEFMHDLKKAMRRVRDQEDLYKKGATANDLHLEAGDHCKFCRVKATCPALRKRVQEDAAQAFDVVPLATEINSGIPEPEDLTPEQIAVVLKNAGILKLWADSVAEYAHKLAEAGVLIPDYKLVAKRSNRKWRNEKDVIKQYELEFGDEIYNKKLKSPNQMEKLLGKRKAEISNLFEKPDSGRVLVPITDKRQECLPEAVTAFDDIDLASL